MPVVKKSSKVLLYGFKHFFDFYKSNFYFYQYIQIYYLKLRYLIIIFLKFIYQF